MLSMILSLRLYAKGRLSTISVGIVGVRCAMCYICVETIEDAVWRARDEVVIEEHEPLYERAFFERIWRDSEDRAVYVGSVAPAGYIRYRDGYYEVYSSPAWDAPRDDKFATLDAAMSWFAREYDEKHR